MFKKLVSCFLFVVALNAVGQDVVSFNHVSGKYEDSIQLIVHGDFDELYYTLDGKIPNKYSKVFKDSLLIDKTVLFKARMKRNGHLLDTVINSFYLINFSKKFPVLSISIDKEDLWSDKKGLFAKGEGAYKDSNGHFKNCNYHKKWEKSVSIIYIEDSLILNQNCGLKLFGESTRANPDKSLKLIARNKYGSKLFKHSFFKNKSLKKHKQLVIRASGNDYKGTRFKDVLSAHLIRNIGLDYMDYQPIHLYVNGSYWGVYNLREKVNEHYLKYNKGFDADSVNIIMGKWVRQQGSSKTFMKMYRWFYRLKEMDSLAYLQAGEFLDLRNYMNYRIFQLFINNADSRGNIRYWNSTMNDGRFRMILYDTDHGYGNYKRSFLQHSLSVNDEHWYNPPWSTRYLRKLMSNEVFKNQFLVQYSHLLNTSLHKDTIVYAVNYFKKMYQFELPRPNEPINSHLRNVPQSLSKWESKVQELNHFSKLRYDFVRNELLRIFDLKGWFSLTVKGNSGRINVNDNLPLCLPYSGSYLKGTSFTVEALDDGPFKFVSWSDLDTCREKLISGDSDKELHPIFEIKEPLKSNVNQIAKIDFEKANRKAAFEFNSFFCFWSGCVLLITGLFLMCFGFYRIKKARLRQAL
ncbi:MAG: CotH kinase family protein [Flavobacteriales bacterium]|nr:CotH kinase family protein [Flavobacteriales bacterium]